MTNAAFDRESRLTSPITPLIIAEISRSEPGIVSSQIPGVTFERRPIDHEDDRRALVTAFNGEFIAAQAKFALIKTESVLGGHYHLYGERFYVLAGKATFTLAHIDNPEVKEVLVLEAGSVLTIPARVAHKAEVDAGTILAGFTEHPYVDAKTNDHKFDL